MKSSKKCLAGLLAMTMVLVMAACGNTTTTSSGTSPASIASSAAPAYPNGNITIVVPANAGGGGDIFARQTAEAAKTKGVNFLVENRPGGGGATAMSYAWGQKHDGYTMMVVTTSTIITNPYSYEMPNEVADWRGVIRVMADATVLFVRKDSGITSLEDFVALAKTKKLSVGGYSVGSVDHIAAYTLGKEAGFEFEYVPYDSGADSIVAVLGGHIDAAFTQYSDLVSNSEAGTVTVLGSAATERYAGLSDVPTFAEKGWKVPDLSNWRGYVVPKDVPDDVVAALHDIVKTAMTENSFKEYVSNSKLSEAYVAPDDFTALIQEQYTGMGASLKTLGIIQ